MVANQEVIFDLAVFSMLAIDNSAGYKGDAASVRVTGISVGL